jgi:hypothetical protein
MEDPGARAVTPTARTGVGVRERQIEFPREQAHNPLVTTVMLAASLACIAIVLILLVADVEGPFIGPW